MEFAAVDSYIQSIYYTDHYTELEQPIQEKIVYTANKMLLRRFDEVYVTAEAVALQTLYMIEGEAEEFAKFKRQGIKSLGLSGMSFSFEGGNVSPEVVALISKAIEDELKNKKKTTAGIARLY